MDAVSSAREGRDESEPLTAVQELPAAQQQTRRTRLDSLTGLRFFAAILVVLHHTVANDVNGNYLVKIPLLRDLATIGFTGVSFFFVLSGFVLAWSARPNDSDRAFWSRRFARVYPLHLLTWLLAIPVLIYAGRNLDIASAAVCLVLLQAWSPSSDVVFGMNPLSWSLSCEAFFYAIFPWLHRRLCSLPRRRLALVVAGCLVGLVLAPAAAFVLGGRHAVQYFYYFPAYRVLEFVIGVCLALAVKDGWRPRVPSWCGPASVFLSIAVAITAAHLYERAGGGDALPRVASALIMLPAFMALIVLVACRDADGQGSVLAARLLVRLGVWSFALYMTHHLILTTFETALGSRRVDGVLPSILVEVAALTVAVVVSALAYRWIEHPAERTIRHKAADMLSGLGRK